MVVVDAVVVERGVVVTEAFRGMVTVDAVEWRWERLWKMQLGMVMVKIVHAG